MPLLEVHLLRFQKALAMPPGHQIMVGSTARVLAKRAPQTTRNYHAIPRNLLHAEEARPRNHRLTAHEVAWVEEEDEEDAPPASRSSLRPSSRGSVAAAQARGCGGSAPKGPNTARGRKMKRISGGSSDEADDGSEAGAGGG